VFKRRICDIVWTDAIEPVEFERCWTEIIRDFNLNGNEWLTTMFELRGDWIPAFYRHENMSGLMRTTSRSESENHFFGQFTNVKLSLVEFLSHFETAMESQRYTHRKNDHATRYTTPDMKTSYVLETQAAEIYTRQIFYDVQEEIKFGLEECMSTKPVEFGDYLRFSVDELDSDAHISFEVSTFLIPSY